jgi:hypothetical protein
VVGAMPLGMGRRWSQKGGTAGHVAAYGALDWSS